jgi:hypothetical protein
MAHACVHVCMHWVLLIRMHLLGLYAVGSTPNVVGSTYALGYYKHIHPRQL